MSESNIHIRTGGFTTLLTILFIYLKLTNQINWSWLWVLSPLWLGLFLIVLITIIVFVALAIADN